MEKVLAVGAATMRLRALKTEPEEAEPAPVSQVPTAGNAMCPVLFLEIVEFSRKPVADQLVLRERFNGRIARALEQVPVLDRLVLETADGVAITFLGGPEAALHVALRFAHTLQPASGNADPLQVRGGINLGPVRLTRDAAGHTQVLGDGINVAQRLLGFAASGQFLVSRAYHEALCQRAPGHKGLFLYQGSRTDSHVREHEVYELDPQAIARGEAPPPTIPGQPVQLQPQRPTDHAHRRLALGGAALAATLLLAAVIVRTMPQTDVRSASAPPRERAATIERPLVLRQIPLLSTPVAQPAAVRPEELASAIPEPTPADAAATAAASPSATPVPAEAPATKPAATHTVPLRQALAKPAPRDLNTASASPDTDTPAPLTAEAPQPSAGAAPAPEPARANSAPAGEPWSARSAIQLPSAPAATKAPTALVLLAISPWGEVFVDGRSVGVSPPLTELELAQGKHRIVVRNANFKPFDEEIELGSNQTLRIKHKFARR